MKTQETLWGLGDIRPKTQKTLLLCSSAGLVQPGWTLEFPVRTPSTLRRCYHILTDSQYLCQASLQLNFQVSPQLRVQIVTISADQSVDLHLARSLSCLTVTTPHSTTLIDVSATRLTSEISIARLSLTCLEIST